MSAYSKRASKNQRAWLQHFERQSGFEAMYQDDFDTKRITFAQLVRKNCRWLESHHTEVLHNVEQYPLPKLWAAALPRSKP